MKHSSPISYIRKKKTLITGIAFFLSFYMVYGQYVFLLDHSKTTLPINSSRNVNIDYYAKSPITFNNNSFDTLLEESLKKPLNNRILNPSNSILNEKNHRKNNNKESVINTVSKDQNIIYSIEKKGIIGTSESLTIDDVSDNIFTIDLPSTFKRNKQVWLKYDLFGLKDASGVTMSINDNLAIGGYLIKQNKSWTAQKIQINESDLRRGKNYIRFSTLQGATHQYMIKNLRLEYANVSPKKAINLHQRKVISYQNNSYISGYTTNLEIQEIQVLDKTYPLVNGVFEVVIKQKQLDSTLTVYYNNSLGKQQSVSIPVIKTEDTPSTIKTVTQKPIAYKQQLVTPLSSGVLSLNGAKLEVPIGSVKDNQYLSVTGLQYKDLPTLSPEMVNVTANHEGYRFLPHGNHFINKPAHIHLKYDKSKFPSGYTAKDVKTFYFDDLQKKWLTLNKDSLDIANNTIISKTTHFTDFINGIIKVPESPETGNYTPTSIKDIKAADPTAGVVSIPPPSPNNMGTVNTSFPIKLPMGRAGMQPNLAINYSSESGNGWMGLGWNLTTPSLSIDTRWGAPRYDPNNETEIYTLAGGMLVLEEDGGGTTNPHRTSDIPRNTNSERQFFPRIEGSYAKIIRHGNSTTNYWWEVTDKMGNKSFYGGYDGTVKDNAVIKTNNGNIANWALYRTEDTNGNYIEYIYDKNQYTGSPGAGGVEFYPKEIKYTLNTASSTSSDNYYQVLFNKDTDTNANQTPIDRKDVQINARLGVVQVTADLLTEIEINYVENNTPQKIRSYEFNYRLEDELVFFKQQLAKITEKDANGDVFYSNTLEYFDEGIGTGTNYNPYENNTWLAQGNDIDDASILSSGVSSNTTIGGSLSFGVYSVPTGAESTSTKWKPNTKSGTFGVDYQYTEGSSTQRMTIADVDADGLPDKVFRIGTGINLSDNFSYRENISGPLGSNSFDGQATVVSSSVPFSLSGSYINSIGTSISGDVAIGSDATIGPNTGASLSNTKSITRNYFTDVNGDGITDIVDNGLVYFGVIDINNDELSYTTDVRQTPNTIASGTIASSLLQVPCEDIQEEYTNAPLHDVVRVWKAPYNGDIEIVGAATLPSSSVDGVTLSIEHNNGTVNNHITGFPLTIPSGTQHAINESLTVQKGDYLYFRVQSIENGEGDELDFPVNIKYTTIPNDLLDSDGNPYNTFNSEDDYLLTSKQSYSPLFSGTLSFSGTISKQDVVSDNVLVYLVHNGTEILLANWAFNDTAVLDMSTLPNLIVTEIDEISLEIRSESEIDWTKITHTNLEFSLSGTVDGTPTTLPQNIIPNYQFYNWVGNIQGTSNHPEEPLEATTTATSLNVDPTNISFTSLPIEDTTFSLSIKQVNPTTGIVTPLVRLYTISSTGVITPAISTFTSILTIDSGDLLYATINFKSRALAQSVTGSILLNGQTVFPEIYVLDTDNLIVNQTTYENDLIDDGRFGDMYQNWGYFIYHGGYGTPPANCTPYTFPVTINPTLPIDPNIILISDPDINGDGEVDDNDNTQPLSEQRFIQMQPSITNNAGTITSQYVGLDNLTYARDGVLLSASRLGMDDMSVVTGETPVVSNPTNGEISAPRTSSRTTNDNASSGAHLITSLNMSTSSGETHSIVDYQDMNGDRYPDVLAGNNVQYTNPVGALSNSINVGGNQYSHSTTHNSSGISIGNNYPLSGKSNKATDDKATDSAQPGLNIGIGSSNGTDKSEYSYIDINGDGLPDRMLRGGNVQLNLGYSFTAPMQWGNSMIDYRNGEDVSSNISAGASVGGLDLGTITGTTGSSTFFNGSISFGGGSNETTSLQNTTMQDVNGDGLVDKLVRENGNVKVYLNTGNEFIEVHGFGNNYSSIGKTVSQGANSNFAYTVAPSIPIIPSTPANPQTTYLKIAVNPSISIGAGDSNSTFQISDINGDGYPDVLNASASDNSSLSVKKSKIGKTHLLKKVNTPLGGYWEVSYHRDGNTYRMPQSKWVLDSIRTYDGFEQDNQFSPGNTLTTAQYSEPHHDRREREFFGYKYLRVNQHDVTNNNKIYRYSHQEYHTNTYYLKGAVKKESLYEDDDENLSQESNLIDSQDIEWSRTETTYAIMNPDMPNPMNPVFGADDPFTTSDFLMAKDKARLFVAPIKTKSYNNFDGGDIANAKVSVIKMTAFDENGNIEEVIDYGENSDTEDNTGNDVVRTEIDYYDTISGVDNSVGFPETIKVYDSNGLRRERQASYHPNTGNLQKVRTKLNNSDWAEVDISTSGYDTYGNLTHITYPENANGERFEMFYTYDNQVHTYPTKVEDAFGYFSETYYNYKFGVPVFTRDMNLQPMRTRIDDRGRVIEITGPYELFVEEILGGTQPGWTIRFEYQNEALVETKVANVPIDDASYTWVANGTNSFEAVTPDADVNTNNENTNTNIHHATTRHFDPEYRQGAFSSLTDNEIVTVTLVDGFGRAIQVKKTHSILKNETSNTIGEIDASVISGRDELKWLIPGKVYTDGFGRAIESYHPTLQDYYLAINDNNSPMYEYIDNVDTVAPTTTGNYDALDRAAWVKLPGEQAQTTMAYAIEDSRFKVSSTNEKLQVNHGFTDIRGRTTKTIQESITGNIVTQFTYNALSELTHVTDVASNVIESFYDLAGRRTAINHPDNGRTTFVYDKASNLTEKRTSNLLQAIDNGASPNNEVIKYNYTYSRLDGIEYPHFTENNVQYYYGEYGNSDAANKNAVGRLWYQVDATGTQYFEYGKLGEVIKNRRSVAVPGNDVYWFQTQWEYDTWNRVKTITYPDEEQVTYHYNKGGELHAMTSTKQGQVNKDIISQLGYDKFGQRTYLRYGNGSETRYSYENDRRRLLNMQVDSKTLYGASTDRQFINNAYQYDVLSNVTAIHNNNINMPEAGEIGGRGWQEYDYDDLNRLVTANGFFIGNNAASGIGETQGASGYSNQKYTLSMSYDSQHNIQHKIQLHEQGASEDANGVVNQWAQAAQTSYQLAYQGYNTAEYTVDGYTYAQPHAPRHINDMPIAPNCCDPATDTRVKQRLYEYDANGNLTKELNKICDSETIDTLRVNLWDEENRLRAVDLNPGGEGIHPIAMYTYDAGGDRIIKHNIRSIKLYQNAELVANNTQSDATLYPSGMLVARVGEDNLAYTKHYFAGSQRVSSKIGTTKNLGEFLYDWTLQENNNSSPPINPVNTSHDQLIIAETAVNNIHEIFNIEAPELNSSPQFVPIQAFAHGEQEKEIYWFHPDHLGSSNYITNSNGVVSQHMEYFAFGETFVEEHKNSHNSPYKFNGKELDEETGNYYYGARYYNPRTSIWLSVDPLAEEMPGWSSYNYAFSNPINYTDPTGMAPEWVPDSNGNLIAEKNDNATTLFENYGISMDDANKMVSGLEKDGNGNVKAGQTLKMDNVFSQSIKSSYGDFSMDNPFGRIDPNDNYSCFTSCDKGTAGETIRNPEGNGTNHIEFDGILRNESTPTDINNLVPRSSIARFVYRNGSARHGAVYYGKSNDGTKYFYTKDGVDAAPRITTLNSIISNYGKPKGLKVQKDFIGRIKDWWNDAPATYESGFYTRN